MAAVLRQYAQKNLFGIRSDPDADSFYPGYQYLPDLQRDEQGGGTIGRGTCCGVWPRYRGRLVPKFLLERVVFWQMWRLLPFFGGIYPDLCSKQTGCTGKTVAFCQAGLPNFQ